MKGKEKESAWRGRGDYTASVAIGRPFYFAYTIGPTPERLQNAGRQTQHDDRGPYRRHCGVSDAKTTTGRYRRKRGERREKRVQASAFIFPVPFFPRDTFFLERSNFCALLQTSFPAAFVRARAPFSLTPFDFGRCTGIRRPEPIRAALNDSPVEPGIGRRQKPRDSSSLGPETVQRPTGGKAGNGTRNSREREKEREKQNIRQKPQA